jgi:hypothetical protein
MSAGSSYLAQDQAETVPAVWVRSIFRVRSADRVLHVLDVCEEECRRRVRERNSTKPAGLYFGDVSDDIVTQVLPQSCRLAPRKAFASWPTEGGHVARQD